ncbi:hypothetical protein [Trinickia acidisoli]|uniref:hypothetical protein n=1 Tax=Trinickia acidisoli TaxID=2767482 RepID=UPI001A8DE3FF|nr:hypothetical protein [Trinickia acidisoli]
MSKVPASWKPYCHRPDATFHLSKFASNVLGHDTGVIFFDGAGAARLKSAVPDQDGDTTDLIVSVQRPPLLPFAFRGTAKSQSFAQFAQGQLQGALQDGGKALDATRSAYHALGSVIEHNKTLFDSTNTAIDVLGVITGVLAVAAIGAEGAALIPAAFAIASLIGALGLVVADGTMSYFELTGDKMHKRELENSWAYQLVEAVGPWMAVPDLLLGGPRAVAEQAGTSLKVRAMTNRVDAAEKELASQREAIDAYTEAHANKLGQTNIMTRSQRMRAKANRMNGDLVRAKAKLKKMSQKLTALRLLELPAYGGTLFGMSEYAVSPPDWGQARHSVSQAWQDGWMRQAATQDPHHPAHVLVPTQAVPHAAGDIRPVMQFQVGIRPHAGAAE